MRKAEEARQARRAEQESWGGQRAEEKRDYQESPPPVAATHGEFAGNRQQEIQRVQQRREEREPGLRPFFCRIAVPGRGHCVLKREEYVSA